MFTRPDDLTDADIVTALSDGWGIPAFEVEYAAVGFGSHHWRVVSESGRWFVNVDDLDARRRDLTETRQDAAARLSAALTIARSINDAGLDFVVAPVPTRANDVVHPINDRYVAAVYPNIDGETYSWGDYANHGDRLAVLDRIVGVHAAPIPAAAMRDDFAIPSRDQLMIALKDLNLSWGPGPYADAARQLLDEHTDAMHRVLAQYDQLVDHVAHHSEHAVITHGEPHRGNTIDTAEGVVLIDWDTALLAPPERDLWALIDEDPQIAHDYSERTGVTVNDEALQLYRLWWDLCEISQYVTEFRQPHDDTEDTRVAWAGLQQHLDPTRWSDLL